MFEGCVCACLVLLLACFNLVCLHLYIYIYYRSDLFWALWCNSVSCHSLIQFGHLCMKLCVSKDHRNKRIRDSSKKRPAARICVWNKAAPLASESIPLLRRVKPRSTIWSVSPAAEADEICFGGMMPVCLEQTLFGTWYWLMTAWDYYVIIHQSFANTCYRS